jgi:hypothetical protein
LVETKSAKMVATVETASHLTGLELQLFTVAVVAAVCEVLVATFPESVEPEGAETLETLSSQRHRLLGLTNSAVVVEVARVTLQPALSGEAGYAL